MSMEDDIARDIRVLSRRYNEACEQNAELDRKIEALESTRQWVRQAKRSAEDARAAIKRFEVSDRWAGRDKNNFESDLEHTLKTRSEKFVRQIKELDSDIGSEIWSLRLKKNHFVSLMQSASQNIDKLKCDLANACS